MAFPLIRYLALGDSFTIGTGTSPGRAFPALLAARWRAEGRTVELVNPAANGYTTDDLIARELPLVAQVQPTLVTLLTGANDIVRGSDLEQYRTRVQRIFRALRDAGVDPAGVVALPQPDWSRSPAAKQYGDPTAIHATIAAFNAAMRAEAEAVGARYVDLFPLMHRQALDGRLAADGLHPSAEAYGEWAERLARIHEGEQPLAGGNIASAVRLGDTVRRQPGPWSPAVHALLRHLERVGFDGAPRILGLDGEGREILSYLEGETPLGWPDPYPAWVWSRETLESAASLLRRYHDAVASFSPPPDARWRLPAGPGSREIVCHNDTAPFNTVYRVRRAFAMIDWDHASPGSRAWDLAYAVWCWAPVTHSPSGEVAESQGVRVRRFLRAYGWGDAAAVIDLLPVRMRQAYRYLRDRAAAGEPAFVEMWRWGRREGILRDAEHAERERSQLLAG